MMNEINTQISHYIIYVTGMSKKNSLPSSSQNPSSTDLAKYRSRAAADHTLMTWMRTSLSLIGFGFVIPTLVKTIAKTQVAQSINTQTYSIIFGLALIAVGIFQSLNRSKSPLSCA